MIYINNKDDIQGMRAAGRLAARTLKEIGKAVNSGVTTEELDKLAENFIVKHGGRSAALNYHGFPKHICASVNEVVCHGIPSAYILKKGDIVNLDVCVELNGYHGDTSRTFCVGENIDHATKKLLQRTYEAMWQAIKIIDPNKTISDVGRAIEQYIQPFGYGIVREYSGHGIGKKIHEEPSVPHFLQTHICDALRSGMIFTIEPMINLGSQAVVVDNQDGWTVRTRDGLNSVQFEHTCLVTETGCEVLTII